MTVYSVVPTLNPSGDYIYFTTGFKDIAVASTTAGANMRYTINGAPPTSTTGTLISGPVNVTPSPGGTTLRVIAYKAGMIDSQVHEAVFYYENDNGGNTNMAQPIDGGPGGGGILIDGGNQPTISYDGNGNLIHYKEWNYRYDAQNRLTQAWNGTTTAVFYYDGKNRQIARNINGVIRFNAWDGWELVEEYSSSLNVATGYLQGSTGVIKSWSAASTLYYYQDRLGSTTHIANASGQLVESYKYDLYGTPSYFNSTSQPINSSTVGVADLYAGERWIVELALYDLRNRFMSPELGRFLQTDPIGFKGDASNLYRYCNNDPVDRSDPMGLDFHDDGSKNVPFAHDERGREKEFGTTLPSLTPIGSAEHVEGGWVLRITDFDLRVRSEVSLNGRHSYDPEWKGKRQPDVFSRKPENVKRTTGHEGDHRLHNRDWYQKNREAVLRGINDGTKYKTSEEANKAAVRKLGGAYEKFHAKEKNDTGPYWPNHKFPGHEH